MKYIKLYENFEEKESISDESWKMFDDINKRFKREIWDRGSLFYTPNGTIEYDSYISLSGLSFRNFDEVIPRSVVKIRSTLEFQNCDKLETLIGAPTDVGSLNFHGCTKLKNLKGCPQVKADSDIMFQNCTRLNSLIDCPTEVRMFDCTGSTNLPSLKHGPTKVTQDFDCGECTKLKNLVGAPIEVGRNFNCFNNNIGSLKGAPKIIVGVLDCDGCKNLISLKYISSKIGEGSSFARCTGLISDINDYNHQIVNWEGYSKEGVQNYLNSEYFSAPVWFESLAFVGTRDTETYVQVCKDFPEETTFTDEQVYKYMKSPLIDRKSTEEDWKIVKDLLTRMKGYDHSEYRDSKLDSEWKDVF